MIRFVTALSVIILGAVTLTAASVAKDAYPRWATSAPVIRGYDTTAYFQHGKANRGSKMHTVGWNGAIWRFASASEAATFKANPTAYQPQFGAYCTGGLSQRHVVHGNPKIWRLHQGKLYMFYARAGAARFDANPAGVIQAASDYAKQVGIRKE